MFVLAVEGDLASDACDLVVPGFYEKLLEGPGRPPDEALCLTLRQLLENPAVEKFERLCNVKVWGGTAVPWASLRSRTAAPPASQLLRQASAEAEMAVPVKDELLRARQADEAPAASSAISNSTGHRRP